MTAYSHITIFQCQSTITHEEVKKLKKKTALCDVLSGNCFFLVCTTLIRLHILLSRVLASTCDVLGLFL